MSTDIIRFIPPPDRGREPTDLPTIGFQSMVESDDFVMDHTDTVPCEYGPTESDGSA